MITFVFLQCCLGFSGSCFGMGTGKDMVGLSVQSFQGVHPVILDLDPAFATFLFNACGCSVSDGAYIYGSSGRLVTLRVHMGPMRRPSIRTVGHM